MGKFIKISSQEAITVNAGVLYEDATNTGSQAADRLNVRQIWDKFQVDIKKGINWYPSLIKNWNTVKRLAEQDIISFAEEVDEVNDDYANATYNRLMSAYKNAGITVEDDTKRVIRKRVVKAQENTTEEI